jgi:integrase
MRLPHVAGGEAPPFVFNQHGDLERCLLRPGNVHSADGKHRFSWRRRRCATEPVRVPRSRRDRVRNSPSRKSDSPSANWSFTQTTRRAAAACSEKIGRNPCSTVPTPKPKRPEVVVLDGQQVMQLLGAARDVLERALFALAITTGMRQGEIFALSWADVDFVAGTVSVRATLTEDLDGKLVRSEPKTTKSRRVIYLPALALKALRAHQAERQAEQGFVFTSADGAPLRKSNFIRRVFKPLLKVAELPDVTFHSLRHTANSLLIEAGEDPLAIAGSLGHADTRMMFERYGHLFSHSGRRVAKTADEIFAALEPSCRTIVVNAADRFGKPRQRKTRKPLRDAGFQLVEMRRLELLTPYMRRRLMPPDQIAEVWRKCGRIRRKR